MELGPCGFPVRGKSRRCGQPAHDVRDIPSLGKLSRQAVCPMHRDLLDAQRRHERLLPDPEQTAT